jgi:Peptidase family S41
MKKLLVIALSLSLSRAPATETKLLDQMPQSSLQSAFEILRRDYIRRDDLTYEELNRAALQGLLERLNFGAALVPAADAATKPAAHVHAEFLAPDVAYLRPSTMGEGEAALFEKELQKAIDGRARHLILDLRATLSPGLFEEAAFMLQSFVPAGEVMFKMKQMGAGDAELFISKGGASWKGTVTALIDEDTNNAAEALAACLAQRRIAFLVGTPTRGAAVRYSEVALDDATRLRFASAELYLPDDTPVFKHGLQPTHPVSSNRDEKLSVFNGSRGGSMKGFITDRIRPRFNERAFVAGTNPELDDYVRRSKGQPLPGDGGQLRDVVTQRALDLIKTREFIAQAKLQPAPPPPVAMPQEDEIELPEPAPIKP